MFKGEGTGLTGLGEQAVREELNRLLESAAFRTSKRCREFLEYIVDHTITGPTGALKERSIGMELFELPKDFDTGQHTIVRVTANEVRKKLAQYYLSANGPHHPVRIDLPPGSYSAEFRWETLVAEPDIETPAEKDVPPILPDIAATPSWLTRRRAIACAAAGLAFGGGVSVWRSFAVKSTPVDAKTVPATAPRDNGPPVTGDLRMIVGAASPYLDRSGRTWGPDRYFTGGSVLYRPSERILRTLDPDSYRHVRVGEFRYDIPLKPGSYELHLLFAETGLADFISAESSGEGQRVFHVAANGKRILEYFDVVADAAGANTADERVFRDISPGDDGFLHLAFTSVRGTPIVSGIELLPITAGKVRPIRIRAGWTASWQDSNGQSWQADSYFAGGNALVRTTNPASMSSSASSDTGLYTSERWGHFSYAVPVADGRYRVTLKFCEGHYGRHNTGIGGVGSRVFDMYCNGIALLRDFDILKEAGGEGRPIGRLFSAIRPTAQGKIVLTFVPVKGMACVNGIEVVEDSR